MDISGHLVIEIFSLVASVAAIIVTIKLYVRTKSLGVYADIDSLYLELLKLSIEHPSFVDPKNTKDYKNSFKGNERLQYEQYALIAWNICETIFDRKDEDELTFKSWKPILEFESNLHRGWFEDERNRVKFKEEFRAYIYRKTLSSVASRGRS